MARLFDDAASQYLEIDSAPATTVPLTMACWFRSDDLAIAQVLMSLADKDVANQMFLLYADGSTAGDPVSAQSITSGGSSTAFSTTGFSANIWHHACGIFAADTDRRAFIDGGSKGGNAISRSVVGIDRLSIGRSGDSTPAAYTSGRIAEVAIWNVALSDAEVKALGRGLSPLYIRSGALVFYAPLWGTSSPERDYTRGQRHLTVTGATQAPHARVMPFLLGGADVVPYAVAAGPLYSGTLGDLGFEFGMGALSGEYSVGVVGGPGQRRIHDPIGHPLRNPLVPAELG